jgi:transposase
VPALRTGDAADWRRCGLATLRTGIIERLAKELKTASKADEELWRLCSVPGVGPVTAVAIAAFSPDMSTFESGRNFAA